METNLKKSLFYSTMVYFVGSEAMKDEIHSYDENNVEKVKKFRKRSIISDTMKVSELG